MTKSRRRFSPAGFGASHSQNGFPSIEVCRGCYSRTFRSPVWRTDRKTDEQQ